MLVRRNKRNFEHGSVLGSGEVFRRSVKKWWTEEKDSILFETKLSRKILYFRQENLILEMLVSILHCKTMYCYQRFLPSAFFTSETERN